LESHAEGSSPAVCQRSSKFIAQQDEGSVAAFSVFIMHITLARFRANGVLLADSRKENFSNRFNAAYLHVLLTHTLHPTCGNVTKYGSL
jgi:hypothetical protein